MKKKTIFERLRGDMEQIPAPYQWDRVAGAAANRKPEKEVRSQPKRPPVYKKVWSVAAAAAMLLLVITAVMVYERQPGPHPVPLTTATESQTQSNHTQPDSTEPQSTGSSDVNPSTTKDAANPGSSASSQTTPSTSSQTRPPNTTAAATSNAASDPFTPAASRPFNGADSLDFFGVGGWNAKPIAERFPSVAWNATEYLTSSNTAIPLRKIGSRLGKYTATGYDASQDPQTKYQADCEIHAIRSISSACAVAVRFAGTIQYFPYINAYYRPDTLGNFIDDLNLRENLRFNNRIDYSCWEGENFVQMEYSLPDPDVIWTMLLSDTGLKNVASVNDTGIDLGVMRCSINVDGIGQRNIALSVTKNGYLTTNILATEKRFFIGKDAVNRFVDYVLEHGSGRRLAETPGAAPVPE